MGLLDQVRSPSDVQALTPAQCEELCAEIRTFLVDKVSRTGGHLGPNLGVVELTLALHRVFDSPHDVLALGHRPPGLRPQAAHRPRRGLRHAAPAGRAVRLPLARRVARTT